MSINHAVTSAILDITTHSPVTRDDKLAHYRGIRDWLNAEISTLEKDMVKSERPHETIARIARETRNAKERRG
jgi:hypothetical protein